MMAVDDGARVYHLVKLIGYAVLTGLHAVDKAGKLTKNSEIRGLGLVMTLYLRWSHGLDENADDEEDLTWRENVVAYAKKAGIDLKTVGCAMDRELEDIGDAEPLENSKKADRWDWKKVVSLQYCEYDRAISDSEYSSKNIRTATVFAKVISAASVMISLRCHLGRELSMLSTRWIR